MHHSKSSIDSFVHLKFLCCLSIKFTISTYSFNTLGTSTVLHSQHKLSTRAQGKKKTLLTASNSDAWNVPWRQFSRNSPVWRSLLPGLAKSILRPCPGASLAQKYWNKSTPDKTMRLIALNHLMFTFWHLNKELSLCSCASTYTIRSFNVLSLTNDFWN